MSLSVVVRALQSEGGDVRPGPELEGFVRAARRMRENPWWFRVPRYEEPKAVSGEITVPPEPERHPPCYTVLTDGGEVCVVCGQRWPKQEDPGEPSSPTETAR